MRVGVEWVVAAVYLAGLGWFAADILPEYVRRWKRGCRAVVLPGRDSRDVSGYDLMDRSTWPLVYGDEWYQLLALVWPVLCVIAAGRWVITRITRPTDTPPDARR